MIKRTVIRRASVIMVMMLLSTSCSGPRSAQDWFDLTWAGLAGSDTLSFKGTTVLLKADQLQPEGSVAFSGELQNHQVLTLTADSPAKTENSNLKTAEAKSQRSLATFHLKGRRWVALSENQGMSVSQPLTRINPLAQLEEIHDTKSKTIRLESGAARGTKVLRVELAPEEAKMLLRRQLNDEMNIVLSNYSRDSQLLQLSPSARTALNREVQNLWSQRNRKMSEKLDRAEVGTVYHLTVDKRTGLPIRLTSNNKISFPGNSNLNKPETLVTDCSFK
ncbi:hypothetical protein EJP77_04610 [Paenibacillus zeisoli]|uniref:Lipoprotein n=1 Tax=Paenibacillus zeisoli TaxID=2496267 RepID=A0A433XQF8_9BACL|nr:hypothetical protein [Paenibacillus zeisoli]RUT36276.1 hypothetical protein EJP77_04610 [Paenibacillus zeisoli]